jgi:hypothetical protein
VIRIPEAAQPLSGILPIVVMDSGLAAFAAPRNEDAEVGYHQPATTP